MTKSDQLPKLNTFLATYSEKLSHVSANWTNSKKLILFINYQVWLISPFFIDPYFLFVISRCKSASSLSSDVHCWGELFMSRIFFTVTVVTTYSKYFTLMVTFERNEKLSLRRQ